MLTVKQLIQNTSKGASVSGYRSFLLQKYEQYRKTTKVQLVTASYYLPYRNPYKNKYFVIYWKVLSETQSGKDIWYDVIVQFNTDDKITPDTLIRVFNNSPQFTYTYAYCYYKNKDLLFPHKYKKIVITEPPKERNPNCELGMDKHLYVAIKTTISKKITYDKIKKLSKSIWPKEFR